MWRKQVIVYPKVMIEGRVKRGTWYIGGKSNHTLNYIEIFINVVVDDAGVKWNCTKQKHLTLKH